MQVQKPEAGVEEVRVICSVDLSVFLRRGEAQIIDVRNVDYFIARIPGSWHAPYSDFNKEVSTLAAQFGGCRKVLAFVCTCGEAKARKCATAFLRHLNKKNSIVCCDVRVLEGGFSLWERHFATHVDAGVYISRGFAVSNASPLLFRSGGPSSLGARLRQNSSGSGCSKKSRSPSPVLSQLPRHALPLRRSSSARNLKEPEPEADAGSETASACGSASGGGRAHGGGSSEDGEDRERELLRRRLGGCGNSDLTRFGGGGGASHGNRPPSPGHFWPPSRTSGAAGGATSSSYPPTGSAASSSSSTSPTLRPTSAGLTSAALPLGGGGGGRGVSGSTPGWPVQRSPNMAWVQVQTTDSLPDLIPVPAQAYKSNTVYEEEGDEDSQSSDESASRLSCTSSRQVSQEDEPWHANLSIGDMINVRSSSTDDWHLAIVTAVSANKVKVQFMVSGRYCMKVINLYSRDIMPVTSESQQPHDSTHDDARGEPTAAAAASASATGQAARKGEEVLQSSPQPWPAPPIVGGGSWASALSAASASSSPPSGTAATASPPATGSGAPPRQSERPVARSSPHNVSSGVSICGGSIGSGSALGIQGIDVASGAGGAGVSFESGTANEAPAREPATRKKKSRDLFKTDPGPGGLADGGGPGANATIPRHLQEAAAAAVAGGVVWTAAEQLREDLRLSAEAVQVIDVRDYEFFYSRITGARHVPAQFFDVQLPALAREFASTEKTIVLHCGQAPSQRSCSCWRQMVKYLEAFHPGWTCQVRVLEGGYPAWEVLCQLEP